MSMDTHHQLKLQDSLNIVSPAPTPSSSPIPSPSPMNKPIKSRRTVIREKWVCDKCRVASFENFDEACRHEENCTGSFEESKCIPAATSSSFSNTNCNIKDTETTCFTRQVTQPTSENDPDIIIQQEESTLKQQQEPLFDIGYKRPCSVVAEATSETATETSEMSNEHGLKEHEQKEEQKQGSSFKIKSQSPPPQDFRRRRSKRIASNITPKTLQVITPPSSGNDGSDHELITSPKKKKKLSTTSVQKNVIANNKNKKAAKTKVNKKQKTTTPLASIFQPLSARRMGAKPSHKTDKSNGVTCKVKPINEEEKASLAEHRAAEFLIKRRANAELEKQRRRKREEARKYQLEQQRTKNGDIEISEEENIASIFHKSSAKKKSVDSDTAHTPFKPLITKKALDNNKLTLKRSQLLLPAPRFPNPSHIMTDPQNEKKLGTTDAKPRRTGQYDRLAQVARYSNCWNETNSRVTFDDYPTTLMDRKSQRQEYDLDVYVHRFVYNGLASAFRWGDLKNVGKTDEDATRGTQLWSDKHTIKSVPDDVCGARNRVTANKLVNFINDWRDNRHQIISTRAKKRCKQQNQPKERSRWKDDDSDYEIWDESEDDDGLCKVFLLTGPSGSGKTSLLYAAAKKCHCLVLEINTSAKRGGQDLKKAIEESTQSYSSFADLKGGIDTCFDDYSFDCQQKKPDSPSLVLVLIDEVDLLFEDDGDIGFWQSLSSLTKNAKCPIILTSTTVPEPLLNAGSINYIHCTLTKPSPMECASRMTEIAKIEGMMNSVEDITNMKYQLEGVARLCNSDLRKIINCMELFSHGSVHLEPKLHFSPMKCKIKQSCTNVFPNPKVFEVSPKIISSTKHTVINIKGKNFKFESDAAKDPCFNQRAKLEVMIGSQLCPACEILNEGTILAVCPPCLLPSGVDKHGHFEDTFEDCLTCAYAPIVVKITFPNGMIIRSDAPDCRNSTNDPWPKKVPHVEYSFPDEDEHEEASTDGEDLSFAELLEKEVAKKKPEDHAKFRPSPQKSSFSLEEAKKEQSQMHQMMQNAELASDAALLEDAHLIMHVPELSGPVRGFDAETSGYKNFFGYDHMRHTEQLAQDLTGYSSFFFGSSDTYVTRPMRQRDRFISAAAHNTRREMALLPSDFVTPVSTSNTSENSSVTGNNSDIFVEAPLLQGEEESFYSTSELLPIQSLSTILRATTMDISGCTYRLDNDIRSTLLEYEKAQRTRNLQKLVQPIIGKNITNSSQDICLDYAPNLRNIAFLESIAESFFNENIKNKAADNLSSLSSRRTTRRQTRNGPKGREHYFEKVLKRNGPSSLSAGTTDISKISGASLADMCLVNVK